MSKQKNINGISEHEYLEHVCKLNRHNQFHDLENGVEKGKALFAVSGKDDIEVEHFAKRFLLSIKQKADPKYLNWEEFCEIRDRDLDEQYARRKNYLYKKIAALIVNELDDLNPAKGKQFPQKILNEHLFTLFYP